MIGNLTAIKELSWEFSKRILFIVNVKIWSASLLQGGPVAEWLACWTRVQKGPGSNRSRDAVG